MFNPFRRRSRPSRCQGRLPHKRALGLEALEDRAVPAVIGGTVYADLNNNGLFDSGEQGLQGSTLQLRSPTGKLLATTTSGPNGQYQFTTIGNAPPPGTLEYNAVFNATPTNNNETQTVSQFNTALGTLTSIDIIASGSLESSVEMENISPSSNQVQAQVSGTLNYRVGGLQPFTSNPTTTLTATLPGFGGGNANLTGPSTKNFGTINLAGTFTEVTLTNPRDMASFEGTGTVSVNESATGNSISTDSTGNVLTLITTTSQGKVRVIYNYQPGNGIPPGQYVIVQTKPPPGTWFPGLTTSDNITPIPGSRTNRSISVTVGTPTDVLMNNNYGELPPARLTGHVYVDVNKVGSIQPGDPGIYDVKLVLTGTNAFGDVIRKVAYTNGSGVYSFGNLLPGTYEISETQPSGYSQGTNNAGSLGGQVQGDNLTAISVDAGNLGTDYDFGEILNSVPPPPPPQITINPPPPSKFYLFGGGW
jgi:hypothetical protein